MEQWCDSCWQRTESGFISWGKSCVLAAGGCHLESLTGLVGSPSHITSDSLTPLFLLPFNFSFSLSDRSEDFYPGVSEDCTLITFDEEALYINVNVALRLLNIFESLLPFLRWFLTHNFFMFQGDFFLAPKRRSYGLQYVCNSATSPILPNSLVYKRYVDDMFRLAGGTSDRLHSLCSVLNSACQVHYDFDLQGITFLDTWIIHGEQLRRSQSTVFITFPP